MEKDDKVEFKSTHSRSMPLLLDMLGVSLAVSTYQAGRVVVCTAEGEKIHTDYIPFDRPMGMAISPDGERFAIGTKQTIVTFANMPQLATKMIRDACYAPRNIHVTGQIDGHDLAYAGPELWQVNTRFSCLSTSCGAGHSFYPRWVPFWISRLAPEDRCHLNGLAVENGVPAYVTVVSNSDTAQGWRENKHDGLLMDVREGFVIGRRLSMPHSPRVHEGHLYFLESGWGGLNRYNRDADPDDCHTPIAHLPGFTRGLDFAGRVAFVGLSRVRETSSFGDLPITQRPQARECGVYAIDIDTGRTLGHISFDQSIAEIFAVTVLPFRRPKIMAWDDPQMGISYALPHNLLSRPVPSMLR